VYAGESVLDSRRTGSLLGVLERNIVSINSWAIWNQCAELTYSLSAIFAVVSLELAFRQSSKSEGY
jgi:hypothetical protein